jgi:AcrR family transcriptional regulator
LDRDSEIEFLREALRRRVEQTSVRHVAAEVQMSHGGVYNLVTGRAVPYGKTLAKLRSWYLREWARGGGALTLGVARYLLEEMLGTIPRRLRARAGLELMDTLVGLYARYNAAAPNWVNALRHEYGAESEEEG